MAKRTGPTNIHLQKLIADLKKQSAVHNSRLWKRIAIELEKPTRQRREVNLSKINRYTKENENIIVPGKVLAAGDLDHPVTIAALRFSSQALAKIARAKGKAVLISDFIKEDPKGKKIRIIG